jgi:putative transcriptional regulator
MTSDARALLLGERLTQLRLALNLPQHEAAARAGVSRETVRNAERGRGTVDTLLRLLAVYGIADRLELLLPEQRPTPEQLLAAERSAAPPRKRARRPRVIGSVTPPPRDIWGEQK